MKKIFKAKKRGASLTGYALMVGLVAVLAISAIVKTGDSVSSLFEKTANTLDAASTGSSSSSNGGSGGSSAPNTAPTLIAGNSISLDTSSTSLDITSNILSLFTDAEGNTPLEVTSATNIDTSCVTAINLNSGILTIDIAASTCTGSFDVTISDSQGLASTITSIQIDATTPTAINAGISDQDWSVLAAWSFQIPANAFSGDNLTYSATGVGGGSLPSWLSFNTGTATFQGTPTASDSGNITLEVSVTGDDTITVMDSFILTINGFTTLSDIITIADDTFRCNNTSSSTNCIVSWPYPSGGPWNIVSIEVEANPGFSTSSCFNSRFDHVYFFNDDASPQTVFATFGRSNSTSNNSGYRVQIEGVNHSSNAPFQYDNSRKRHQITYNATTNNVFGTITDIDSGTNWSPNESQSVPSVASTEMIRFRPMKPQAGCTPSGVTNGEIQIISISLSQ